MQIIHDIRNKKDVVKKQVPVYFGDDDFVPLQPSSDDDSSTFLPLGMIGTIKKQYISMKNIAFIFRQTSYECPPKLSEMLLIVRELEKQHKQHNSSFTSQSQLHHLYYVHLLLRRMRMDLLSKSTTQWKTFLTLLLQDNTLHLLRELKISRTTTTSTNYNRLLVRTE